MGKAGKRSGIRVGVIGLNMGRGHVRNFVSSPDVEAVYVCDIVAERREAARSECGLTTPDYADYRELLANDEIDAVSVCLPNCLHAPVTLDALRAGKHVLCEKPMATTAAAARRMVAAAAKARRMLTVHFNQRFSPEAHFVKGLAERGELGEIYIGKCLWVRRRGIPARRSFYQKASSGGGALIDIGVHVLDLTMWLMGHPEPVAVSGCTYGHFGPDVDPAFDVDDHAVAFVRFGNGAALTLEASWASHVEGEAIGFELRGTRGGARRAGSYAGDYCIFQTLGDVCVDVTPCAPLPPVANAQHQFAASVLHGTPNPAPGEDGLAVQRVLEAIYKSAASGREVRLAPTAARRKRG